MDDLDAIKTEVIENSRAVVSEFALHERVEDVVFVIEDGDGRQVRQFPLNEALSREGCTERTHLVSPLPTPNGSPSASHVAESRLVAQCE